MDVCHCAEYEDQIDELIEERDELRREINKLKNLPEDRPQSRFGYMCQVDFTHELGDVENTVYPSVKSLEKARKCVKQCGIVKVKIEKVELVKNGQRW